MYFKIGDIVLVDFFMEAEILSFERFEDGSFLYEVKYKKDGWIGYTEGFNILLKE